MNLSKFETRKQMFKMCCANNTVPEVQRFLAGWKLRELYELIKEPLLEDQSDLIYEAIEAIESKSYNDLIECIERLRNLKAYNNSYDETMLVCEKINKIRKELPAEAWRGMFTHCDIIKKFFYREWREIRKTFNIR